MPDFTFEVIYLKANGFYEQTNELPRIQNNCAWTVKSHHIENCQSDASSFLRIPPQGDNRSKIKILKEHV